MWSDICVRDLLDSCIHAFGRSALHLVGGMTVDVKGEGCGGMAKVFLNRLYIITVLQRGNGKAVPKVVEPHFGNTDLPSDPFELLVQRLVEDVVPDLICKDEIIGVAPELAGFFLCLQLMLAALLACS